MADLPPAGPGGCPGAGQASAVPLQVRRTPAAPARPASAEPGASLASAVRLQPAAGPAAEALAAHRPLATPCGLSGPRSAPKASLPHSSGTGSGQRCCPGPARCLWQHNAVRPICVAGSWAGTLQPLHGAPRSSGLGVGCASPASAASSCRPGRRKRLPAGGGSTGVPATSPALLKAAAPACARVTALKRARAESPPCLPPCWCGLVCGGEASPVGSTKG